MLMNSKRNMRRGRWRRQQTEGEKEDGNKVG
jgi:hypothetical protein